MRTYPSAAMLPQGRLCSWLSGHDVKILTATQIIMCRVASSKGLWPNWESCELPASRPSFCRTCLQHMARQTQRRSPSLKAKLFDWSKTLPFFCRLPTYSTVTLCPA